MNYGEVLSRAWRILWKHKVLWIFGILAALGSGGGGGSGGGSGGGNAVGQGGTGAGMDEFGRNFSNLIQQYWWVLVVLAVLIFLFIIVMIVLSTFGQIGLIRGAAQADDGAEKLTFATLFSESGHYFWRIVGLNLLLFVLSMVIILPLALGIAGFTVVTFGIGLLCLLPLLCIMGIIGWMIQIILRYTITAIVTEDRGIFEALGTGWNLFRDHLGESLVMGLILGVIGWFSRLIIGLPFLITIIPLGVALIAGQGTMMNIGIASAVILACIYLPVAVFLGGLLEGYLGTSWTLTFRRLSGLGLPPPVVVVPVEETPRTEAGESETAQEE